jgi:hypothetical protein
MRPAQEIEVVLVARPGAKRSFRWDGGAPRRARADEQWPCFQRRCQPIAREVFLKLGFEESVHLVLDTVNGRSLSGTFGRKIEPDPCARWWNALSC